MREFFGLYPKRNVKQLFDDSLNTTLARTINTSLSTLIVLLCIFILGGDSNLPAGTALVSGTVPGVYVAARYSTQQSRDHTAKAFLEPDACIT